MPDIGDFIRWSAKIAIAAPGTPSDFRRSRRSAYKIAKCVAGFRLLKSFLEPFSQNLDCESSAEQTDVTTWFKKRLERFRITFTINGRMTNWPCLKKQMFILHLPLAVSSLSVTILICVLIFSRKHKRESHVCRLPISLLIEAWNRQHKYEFPHSPRDKLNVTWLQSCFSIHSASFSTDRKVNWSTIVWTSCLTWVVRVWNNLILLLLYAIERARPLKFVLILRPEGCFSFAKTGPPDQPVCKSNASFFNLEK